MGRERGVTTPNSWAMTPKPGAIIGPHAPTTAVSMQMMNSIKSFFQSGQFNGSRGESLGCGTRMISLSFPVPCFKCAVPETKRLRQYQPRNVAERESKCVTYHRASSRGFEPRGLQRGEPSQGHAPNVYHQELQDPSQLSLPFPRDQNWGTRNK
jgi:hypothetical protein